MKKEYIRNLLLVTTFAVLWLQGMWAAPGSETGTVSLNGEWLMGYSRDYTCTVTVPGIPNDPALIVNKVLWYKRDIELPEGDWGKTTLELKGARFLPKVYVNGILVGERNGGMVLTLIPLDHKAIKPGNTITLEIALASLADVPVTDASYIPEADQWRSNVSSCLWDDVVLHLHGKSSIQRIIPFVNFSERSANVRFDLHAQQKFRGFAQLEIIDSQGQVRIRCREPVSGPHGGIGFNIGDKLQNWSPDHPNLYRLKLTISDENGRISDQSVISFGIKSVEVVGKQFYLNGHPFFPKGVTTVWHRWTRTPEGVELGYDTTWFVTNILQRTKDLGGNYLRFHLGVPPERFLDLCDRHGLAVQYEWSFFHGAPASRESLLEQYRNWLDLAMRHPSVSFIHPYNETEGDQLKTVWGALEELLAEYPPLVVEDRDVVHIHKYWWSLFENLGLYYDDAGVFPKAIMVDEFGGNYLDEEGNPGEYTTVRETFLRFLGRSHTAGERLDFQARANARVAEYWRRIGAAGISPFCALGSRQDGNTWFLGPLEEGHPKPVWEALAATFSPQSVSIELWDRNFEPGQDLLLPLYLFNDLGTGARLMVALTLESENGSVLLTKNIASEVPAYGKKITYVDLKMPSDTGNYMVKAELVNSPPALKYPVVSQWDFRVYKTSVPDNLKGIRAGIPEYETELKQFLNNSGINTVCLGDLSADILITSLATWKRLSEGDNTLSNMLQDALRSGKSVVMLDVGDRMLGQGYPEKAGDLGPLQGVVRLTAPRVNSYDLFEGISLEFTETAEPESHLHPGELNRDLWDNLPDRYTWLWNGYRGGLIVPAADMEFSGLSRQAFVSQWVARGANENNMVKGPCYAYELQGFYGFSAKPDDSEVQKILKDRIDHLIQDAPALAAAINPRIPVEITDLHQGYLNACNGIADTFIPLASCGKNLTRKPVVLVGFGQGRGRLLVSQLLTSGRLAGHSGEEGLYGIRYDVVAAQFVLNMMSLSLKDREE
jgi:beta-galactosidase